MNTGTSFFPPTEAELEKDASPEGDTKPGDESLSVGREAATKGSVRPRATVRGQAVRRKKREGVGKEAARVLVESGLAMRAVVPVRQTGDEKREGRSGAAARRRCMVVCSICC